MKERQRMAQRRPILDEPKRAAIVAILAVGCSRRTAARYVGCAPSTIRRTAQRDPAFGRLLRKAECRLEVTHLRNIRTAASMPQYWRAAAWALEHLRPAAYAARRTDALSPAQVEAILVRFAELMVAELPDAQARRRVRRRVVALARTLAAGLPSIKPAEAKP